MIFQFTWEKVLSKEKTQSRRIVKRGDDYIEPTYSAPEVVGMNGDNIVFRWKVGKSYAVQPGRGMKAVGRIKILRIRREDVRKISDADVEAEGFRSFAEFIRVWAKMHSPHDVIYWTSSCSQEYWQSCTRDSDAGKYQAWVLEFCLEDAAR